MARGKLTEEIRQKAIELLPVTDFNQTELRLLPYVLYCCINGGKIDRNKISREENRILINWRELELLEKSGEYVALSKQFYDAANELVWLSYANES